MLVTAALGMGDCHGESGTLKWVDCGPVKRTSRVRRPKTRSLQVPKGTWQKRDVWPDVDLPKICETARGSVGVYGRIWGSSGDSSLIILTSFADASKTKPCLLRSWKHNGPQNKLEVKYGVVSDVALVCGFLRDRNSEMTLVSQIFRFGTCDRTHAAEIV